MPACSSLQSRALKQKSQGPRSCSHRVQRPSLNPRRQLRNSAQRPGLPKGAHVRRGGRSGSMYPKCATCPRRGGGMPLTVPSQDPRVAGAAQCGSRHVVLPNEVSPGAGGTPLLSLSCKAGHWSRTTMIACAVLRVYYESIKRELKIKSIHEYRCDERLQTKSKEFTRLPYTGLVLDLEHLKIET